MARSWVSFLLIFFLTTPCFSADPWTYKKPGGETCDRLTIFMLGDISAFNDVWGSWKKQGDNRDYVQCLETDNGMSGRVASYRWNFLKPSKNIVSYPHVTYGWDWNGKYTTSKLPISVMDRRPLLVKYDISTAATGRYNSSFDIWLSKTSLPSRQQLTNEIMIWVVNSGIVQGWPTSDRLIVNDRSFSLHVGTVPKDMGPWKYIAFLSDANISKSTIDLRLFIDFLLKRKLIEPDELILGISFGNEIAEGSGKMSINKFELTR